MSYWLYVILTLCLTDSMSYWLYVILTLCHTDVILYSSLEVVMYVESHWLYILPTHSTRLELLRRVILSWLTWGHTDSMSYWLYTRSSTYATMTLRTDSTHAAAYVESRCLYILEVVLTLHNCVCKVSRSCVCSKVIVTLHTQLRV